MNDLNTGYILGITHDLLLLEERKTRDSNVSMHFFGQTNAYVMAKVRAAMEEEGQEKRLERIANKKTLSWAKFQKMKIYIR